MPIDVRLVTEHGEIVKQLANLHGVIESLQPPIDDPTSICWRFIDPWGDTYFNHLQMQPFIEELDRLASGVHDDQSRRFLDQVRMLAEECRDRVHLYLMFYGD
jgi:hypothetical protein